MSSDFFYVATDLGATVRGIAVLRALGSGWLITEYQRIPKLERVPWLGNVVLGGDVYLWDGPRPDRLWPAVHLSLNIEQDVDEVLHIPSPIVTHGQKELNHDRATAWWANPCITVCLPGEHAYSYETDSRILSTRHTERRDVRQVVYGLGLYWPAMELMIEAESVLGGEQSQAEWAVVQGKANPDGAKRAAAKIHELIGR